MSHKAPTSPTSIDKIIITSALPYANGPIHFGHIAGAYLPADIYTRFKKATGADVIFICGSDEHGVAITFSAEKEGIPYQEYVNKWYKDQKLFFDSMKIEFDFYGRTSLPEHAKLAQQFFLDLLSNGFIKPKVTKQHFCSTHNFLADRYLSGTCPYCKKSGARGDECPACGRWLNATDLVDVKCAICSKVTKLEETKHWFLQLQTLSPKLKEWINKQTEWRAGVKGFALSMIEEGLKERAITRDLTWGVPVPLEDAKGKVLYVWFDAPIGYISITQEWADAKGTPALCNEYWQDKRCKLIHFLGKDNIPFHAIVWPAMLMGQKQPYILPSNVVGNEFFHLEGKKFSKSEGWYIDSDSFFKKFNVDSLRYYLARVMPETADSSFYWKEFQKLHNTELADIYGNFVNRLLTFIQKYFNEVVPPPGKMALIDNQLIAEIPKILDKLTAHLEKFEIRSAVSVMMDLARAGNKYFNDSAPWSSRKDNPDQCATTLHTSMQLLHVLAVATYPFMPSIAGNVWKQANFAGNVKDVPWSKSLPNFSNHRIGQPSVLFKKIEDAEIETELAKLPKVTIK